MVRGDGLGATYHMDVQVLGKLCDLINYLKFRRSYARFSTVPFTLEDLDGQIHLTNNAIQRKFNLSEDCHEDLPYEKMWFCEELDEYLASIGHVNSFRQKIYPAMKNILTQTCLAAQENAEPRRRRYCEFYSL